MRTALRRLRSDREAGVTLVEVVVALLLLAILSAVVVGLILQAQSKTRDNRNRVAASNLAQREIDIVRDEFGRSKTAPVTIANAGTVVNPHQLAGGTAGDALLLDGTPYTVRRAVQWNVTGTGSSACDGGTLVLYPTLEVTVTVTWPNMGVTNPVVTSAALAPEKGTGIPTTSSFVAVKVSDETGEPSPGISVKVAGGSSAAYGSTDSSGCAVVQVNPAASSGTSYTASIDDAAYVDMSGATKPSKVVGVLTQGQLNNSVTFQVAKAGSITLRLVDVGGNVLPAANATGQIVTLVASEYTGPSGAKQYTMTGPTMVLTGLWPTQYGAYFGTTVPAGGYEVKQLEAGGSITVDAVLQPALFTVTNLPAGTTNVFAAPAGITDCTAASVEDVDPAAGNLLPGSWNFFVSGPTFTCATGPSALALTAGQNGAITWGTTAIKVTGAPSGTLWALHQNGASTGMNATTCSPSADDKARAVNIDAARTGFVTLAGGSWFVYVGDATGSCTKKPAGLFPYMLNYGTNTTLTWPANSVTATITGFEAGVSGTLPRLALSTSNEVGKMSCSSSTIGAGTSAATLTGLGRPASSSTVVSATVSTGTAYFVASVRTGSGTSSSNYTCYLAGTINVSADTSSLSTLDFNIASPGTVGP